MLSAPLTLPPAFIRETLYAPPCPPPAAALFDAGLVLQNEGKFAFAINATLQAQQAWESALLEEHYPDIEDKVAHSILLRLRQNEKREIEVAEAERVLAEEEEERQRLEHRGEGSDEDEDEDEDDEAELLRQMEALNDESDEAAEARLASQQKGAASRPAGFRNGDRSPATKREKSAQKEGGTNKRPTTHELEEAMPDANAVFLQQQQMKAQLVFEEAARRRSEEEEAANIAFAKERERKRREKVRALHHVYELLPVEGKIFIQMRLSSIYESAGDDEKALASSLYALRFVQTTSSFTESPITATIYSSLGVVYAHLAQLEYASDYFFRALEIRESGLGEGHVDTATTMHNIGCVLHNLQKPNDALVCYYKALEVFKRLLPLCHPRIETCELNIRKSKEMQFKGLKVPPVLPAAN